MNGQAWRYPGARWWKFDFHSHTPASECAKWPKGEDGGPSLTARQWLLKFMQAEVDCVAVTDHNTGDWIDPLKVTYQQLRAEQADGFRELHLFPGVELSVNGGVHVLAILDPSKTKADIDALLVRVEYEGTKGKSDGVTRKSLLDVIEIAGDAGAVVIPAHAERDKGLLHLADPDGRRAALDAGTLRQALRSKRIVAMEVCDRGVAKPQVWEEEGSRNWTEVLGSDCHTFRGNQAPGVRFTWVKMAEPSAEGLYLALLDGAGFSVRRSDDAEMQDPTRLPRHFVERIEIARARYMGRENPEVLALSPWFNALVGGRGTGKSTVVHALRLAYRRADELARLPKENEARRTYERFDKAPANRGDEGALDFAATKRMEILVTVSRDGNRCRLRWRQDGSGVAVEEENRAGWVASLSQNVPADRFPLRIFSQGQIAALAGESQLALLDLIDAAADVRPLREKLDEARNGFLALRARAREMDGRLKGREELLVKLEDVNRKLAGFEGQAHAEILKEFQRRRRQNVKVDAQLDAAAEMAAQLRQAAEALQPEDLPQGLFDAADEVDCEALGIVGRVHASIGEAAARVRQAADQLDASAALERRTVQASAWFAASFESANRYQELSQRLAEQGVADPSEYGKMVQERQHMERAVAQLDSLGLERERVSAQSASQRDQARLARRAITSRRQRFLAETLEGNPYVKIMLQPYGRSPREMESELRAALEVIDGRFEDDILELDGDRPVRGLVRDLVLAADSDVGETGEVVENYLGEIGEKLRRACEGKVEFGAAFNKYLQRSAEKRPEFLDRLLLWSPEDSLQVEYSQKGDGKEFKSIQQASAGQRAAAMLAFLLAHGEEPLVLDQPEDDLDNHLIYELVVRQIRELKMRRQLIVVTHNPNIVVNGDAEMVHAFDFAGGQCRVVESGSLQDQAIREEVCRVMEGGREAFERRFRRLGTERRHV